VYRAIDERRNEPGVEYNAAGDIVSGWFPQLSVELPHRKSVRYWSLLKDPSQRLRFSPFLLVVGGAFRANHDNEPETPKSKYVVLQVSEVLVAKELWVWLQLVGSVVKHP
jgi:hypothetical protein